MPKKAKDKDLNLAIKKETKKAVTPKSTSKTTKKSNSTTSASPKKKTATTAKKSSLETKTSKKGTTNTSTNTVKEKKESTSSKKTTTKTKKATTNSKSIKKVSILEYYDLPYHYNQTVVKVLAQTPTTLFVYWDISEEDKQNYIKEYGEYFFHNTKPVLIIYNETKQYQYEIDINDFANSWYLHLADSNCHYKIELGRRPLNQHVSIPNNYLYVTSSNKIETPNDHVLLETFKNPITFKNVKTNISQAKDIILPSFITKLQKFYSISDFYEVFYPEEVKESGKFDFSNPSSGNPTSTFK